MKNKINKQNRKTMVSSIFLSLIVIILLGIFLSYNLNKKNRELQKFDRYAIIGKKNIIVVYEDKLAIKIPFDIQIDKNTTIKDLVKSGNYKLVISSVNKFLPEKIKEYKVIKYGYVPSNVKNSRDIPELKLDDKRYILTSGIQELFTELYGDELKNSTNIVIDILNANGIGGYARKTGERLKKDLNVTYTAANYNKNTNYSLVKINEINKENLENILANVNEKYFKIQEDTIMPTLASVVLVLGKEKDIDFEIEIKGSSQQAKVVMKELESSGYKNISIKKGVENLDKSVIRYNKEDYYTALKLSKILNINNMLEENSLKNKINILVNK